ncbi:MAG: hypothetical protein FIA97_19835 [Methylococcaceae bacterium]|nr:hypothetical protein [Methylococcaceae bacterium]
MVSGYRCPNCGTVLMGDGRLGTPEVCGCGQPIAAPLADKARRYWMLQAALPYGAATFLTVLAVFHAELPADPWERFLSPILVAPSVASVVMAYRIFRNTKRDSDSDIFLHRCFVFGMAAAGFCFVAAAIAIRF